MSHKVMRERREKKDMGFTPRGCLHMTYRSFSILVFFLHIATNASAENNMVKFKTLLGHLLVGHLVVEDTLEGQRVLKVFVQNDNVCDYDELLIKIQFIGKSPDGTPQTNEAIFVSHSLLVGKSVFAISYFPTVLDGPWQVQEVLEVNGYCPKEDAERIRIKEVQQEEKRRKLSEIRNKYKTIGFKGLHIGMTRNDLNLLFDDNDFPWRFQFHSSSIDDDLIFLSCNSCNIGCVGKGETESCYEIEYGHVEFYKNRIIRIGIHSPSYSANNIDPYLMAWARFAKHGLSTKYGNPARSPLPFERINIFSFKENYYIPTYIWTKGSSEISVNLTHSEYKYYVVILYDDNVAIQGKNNEKKKNMKIEF